MSKQRPTLKDIAQSLGVSATTVHRALQGKEGVSALMSEEIRRRAMEMGYRTNYMASSLKRKAQKLAIAFPEPTLDNRYYYMSLWRGVRKFFREVSEFHVEPMEFYYPLAPGSNGAILREIYEHYAGEIAGLITIATDHPQSSYFLEKLAAKGIPITLVGADLYSEQRLCCVKAYDEMAGSLAAELLTAFQPKDLSARVLVTGNPVGSFDMLDQYYNMTGFESYLRAHAPGVTLQTTYHSDVHVSEQQLRTLLTQDPEVLAIYSTSARHTVMMSLLVEELGLQGKVRLIGSDLFPESLEALESGTLTAIVDKKVPLQSYRAAQYLFDHVIKGAYPPSGTIFIPPSVLLHSNGSADASQAFLR